MSKATKIIIFYGLGSFSGGFLIVTCLVQMNIFGAFAISALLTGFFLEAVT